jgi:hypothetical protein
MGAVHLPDSHLPDNHLPDKYPPALFRNYPFSVINCRENDCRASDCRANEPDPIRMISKRSNMVAHARYSLENAIFVPNATVLKKKVSLIL